MGSRPMVLCKLEKGKLIDSQDNFVDTFNWMVDYINNLRGDGIGIEVSNPTTNNPVIRLVKGNNGGTFDGIEIKGLDYAGSETSGNAIKSIKFQTGSDSKESFHVTADADGNVTVTLDTYWK